MGRKGGFRIEIPKYDFTGLKQLTAKLPKLPNIQERLTAGRATQRAQAAEAYSKALAAMRKQIRETKTDAELLKPRPQLPAGEAGWGSHESVAGSAEIWRSPGSE